MPQNSKNCSGKLQKMLAAQVVGLHKSMAKKTVVDFDYSIFLPCFVIVWEPEPWPKKTRWGEKVLGGSPQRPSSEHWEEAATS